MEVDSSDNKEKPTKAPVVVEDDDEELEEGEVKDDDDDDYVMPGSDNTPVVNTTTTAKPGPKKVRIVKVKRSKKLKTNTNDNNNQQNSIAPVAKKKVKIVKVKRKKKAKKQMPKHDTTIVDDPLLLASALDEDLRIIPPLSIPTQFLMPPPELPAVNPVNTFNTVNTVSTISYDKPIANVRTSMVIDDDLEDTRTSSYDAINKMLSMLRQSTQGTDEGSSNVTDPSWHNIIGSPASTCSSSYRLVPITVEGIDYSRYRILSQTDHKLRNDPRLQRRPVT